MNQMGLEQISLGHPFLKGFAGGSVVKNPPASVVATGDVGLIPGSGRSPGGGKGSPLQYSCLNITWTEEPVRLQSMGSQRVGQQLSDRAHARSVAIQLLI